MTWWRTAGLCMWMNVCGVWAGLLIAQFVAKAKGLLLARLPAGDIDDASWPSVAVIIPARDEADNIRACVESVLAPDYPRLRVIVVDDRSGDATPVILASMAAGEPRLHVISNTELPPGWMGKSHALWLGTRQANEDWLLFVDADCLLDPPAVKTAIHVALQQQADLLSLWPRQAPGGFWEHLLIPLCGGIIALWYGNPIGRTKQKRPFANGQFLMMRRAAYEQIDGHRAIRQALIEDVVLAEQASAAGLVCWSGSGSDLFSVRMYRSLREIVNGWTRIYVGALRSRLKLFVSMIWLLTGSLLPYAALAYVLTRAAMGRWGPLDPALLTLSLIHLSLMMIVSWRFWGLGHCRRAYLLLYPASCLVVLFILGRALVVQQTRRAISWRDTQYAINRAGAIQDR